MSNTVENFRNAPYPVVLVNEQGEILSRNRLAQKLLPPPSRLKGFLKNLGEKRKAPIFEAELCDIRYFVGVLPEKDGCFSLCFLEHFLPFYEPFSRMILSEMQGFFWELFSEGGKRETQLSLPGFLDALAARTYRLRNEEKGYLRLLQMRNYVPGESVSCSVEGFFHHLQATLSKRGIRLTLEGGADTAVAFSTEAFTLLALNLVQFAYLFEGADEIFVHTEKRDGKVELCFSFPDPAHFSSVLSRLLDGKEEQIPGALLVSPLFCALCLCRKENILWKIRQKDNRFEFSVFLPLAKEMPAAFLAESTAKEVKELLNLEKEWFAR